MRSSIRLVSGALNDHVLRALTCKDSVSEERTHPKTNACCPVILQLGAGHEPAGGPVDSVDHDRVRGADSADGG